MGIPIRDDVAMLKQKRGLNFNKSAVPVPKISNVVVVSLSVVFDDEMSLAYTGSLIFILDYDVSVEFPQIV